MLKALQGEQQGLPLASDTPHSPPENTGMSALSLFLRCQRD